MLDRDPWDSAANVRAAEHWRSSRTVRRNIEVAVVRATFENLYSRLYEMRKLVQELLPCPVSSRNVMDSGSQREIVIGPQWPQIAPSD